MNRNIQVFTAATAFSLLPLQILANDADQAIRDRLTRVLPDYEINSIHETPVPGVYEVLLDSELVYVSGDGRYMFQGRLIDLKDRKDLTETSPRLLEARKRQARERVAALEAMGEDTMVIFSPEHPKHTISVFTDIDCGYCRKLHREIQSYLDEGIRVRYLFYPRAGAGSPSYDKAVSVWCADDRNQAMTDAKAGKTIEKRKCANPVLAHMNLGHEFGVSGTPTIVLEDGTLVPGYMPAKRLSRLLESKSK